MSGGTVLLLEEGERVDQKDFGLSYFSLELGTGSFHWRYSCIVLQMFISALVIISSSIS